MFTTTGSLIYNSAVMKRPAVSSNRVELLTRYRRLREINKQHHSALQKFLTKSAIMAQAKRLGLVQGKTLILESMDDMDLIFDLSIYTAPKDRSRTIDRYAASLPSALNADKALVLEVMRRDRFSIVAPVRRHEVAGLVVEDMLRGGEYWLVDEGLERSLQEEAVLATRLYFLEDFAMTAGVGVLVNADLLNQVLADTPLLRRKTPEEAVDDRRFAEAIYRAAIANGTTERLALQDLYTSA